MEPRLLLSADSVLAGLTGALTNGLDAVGTEIDQLLTGNPLLDKYVPGIVEERTTGDDTREVSPTIGEALSIDFDVFDGSYSTAFDFNPAGASLADRYEYMTSATLNSLYGIFGGDAQGDEASLKAMDIDADGQISVDEAFEVFVAGRLQSYLESTTIVNQNGAADVDVADLAQQVANFLDPLFGVVPLRLTDRINVDIDNVSWSIRNDALTFETDVSVSLIQRDRFDLGYEADKLGILPDPGTPPQPNPSPFKVAVERSAAFGSLQFGFTGISDNAVTNNDFFFASPDRASDPNDGVRIGLSIDSGGSPVAPKESGNFIAVNVGFLGAHFIDPAGAGDGGMLLDMALVGAASDPSNVSALGFTGTQGVANASGVVEADAVPDTTTLATTPIQFTLKVGNDDANPGTELTLAQAGYADTAAILSALNTITLAGSALAGIVSATDDNNDNRIEFRLVASDPTQLGFLNEQSAAGTLQATNGVAGLIGVGKSPFALSFLLSVNNQVRLVTVNVTVDADGIDNLVGPPASNDDDNDEITIASLVADLQTGLNAAGFSGAVTASNNGNTLRISGAGTVEISHTLTLDTLERITLSELTGASQIFDMAVDGDAVFSLDLALRADAGLEDGNTVADDDYRPEGTIKLTLDPFDGNDVKGVVVDTIPGTSTPVVRASFLLTDAGGVALKDGASDMQDLLDFNVINVADILGTFSEIGTWFDRLAGTDLLQGFDLPFADSVLGDLLNFKDLITDTFLIDDLDNGAQADTGDLPKLLDWVSIGGAEKKLVALFGTAQQLEADFNTLLSPLDVAGTVVTISGKRNLTYQISVADIDLDVAPEIDGTQPLTVPLDFELNLDPFANFETSGELLITGKGDISFTLGVILGDAAVALDEVGPDSTLLSTLNSNAGVRLNTNLALSTLGTITPLVGRLSADAQFDILISGDPTLYTVTLTKAQTIDNKVLLDPDPGADNPTSLIDDLNDALAAAGLGTKIRAVAEPVQGSSASARILLVATDPAITRFQTVVSSGNAAYYELGMRTQSASTVSLLAPEAPPSTNPAAVNFTLTIFRTGNPVGAPNILDLTDLSTNENVSLQSLVNDLSAILPTGIVASQSSGRLVLSAIDKDIESFSVTNAAALGFRLAALTGELADLDVATLPTVLVAGPVFRAGAAPSDPFGRLAAPVNFTIDIGDGNGAQGVSVSVAATATNASTDDLLRSLNTALEVNLAGKVAALSEGGRIVLRAIHTSVTAITVAGLDAGMSTALGIANGSSTAPLGVRSALNAPVSYGVSDDVSFTVTINGEIDVATLTRENTITNRSLYDLAASLNNAINAAVGGFNSNPLIATVQSGQIVIGLKTSGSSTNLIGNPAASLPGGGGIAPAAVTAFSIHSGDAEVRDELRLVSGLGLVNANNASDVDFIIYFRDGSSAQVTLDALETTGDQKLDGRLEALISAIENAPGAAGKINVQINTDGTSLKLTDLNLVGTELFRVVAVNGSPAAAQLAILGSDTSQLNVGEVPAGASVVDHVIDGGKIATIELRDRIYLSNVGASADLTVASGPDGLSAEATFGFAGVQLSFPASTTLFSATADLPILDAPITLRALFDALANPANPLDLSELETLLAGGPTLTLLADITMTVATFPDASALIQGAGSATVALRTNNDGDEDAEQIMLDLADMAGALPNLGFIVVESGFGDLLKFQDIEFDDVIAALQAIADFLKQFETFDFLSADIPVLGLSVNDLISMADEFQAAVDDFQDNPAGGIQALAQKILEGLGLPTFSGGAALQQMQAYFRNIGIPDADIPGALTQLIQFVIDGDILRFDLRLPVGFNKGLAVDLDLGAALGTGLGPVDIQGGANLAASGYFDARLAFGIDLSDPTKLVIYDDVTGIFAGLDAGAQNVQFNAAIGPLGVFVKDGSIELDLAASVDVDNGSADPIVIALVGAPGFGEISLGDFLLTLEATLSGSVAATLPVYVPTDSDYLADITFSAGFVLSSSDGLELDNPQLSVPDLSGIDLSSLNPFNSIPQMLDALDFFLMGLQDIMDGEVFSIELPLIGEQLQGAADFIEDLRRDVLAPIRTYAEQAPELGLELVQKLLFSLLGAGSDTVMIDNPLNPGVEVDLSDFLGLAGDFSGLGLLKEYNPASDVDSTVEVEDIVASNDGTSNFQWLFRLGQTFTPSVDIDFDLGIPAIAFAMDVGLDVVLDWDLALGLGIGTADGAYIFIGDHRAPGAGDNEELTLSISVDVAQDSEILGSLGFLQLEISEAGDLPGYTDDPDLEHDGPGTPPRNTFIAARFGVDLVNGSDSADERLSFSELGSLTAQVSLSAEAEVNLDVTARFNPEILPDAISALLPEISARFVLDWETGNLLDVGDFDFASSLKLLGFRDVEVNMGSFISEFLGPFVEKIAEVTGPLQPIIDVITAPIPVISDLAGQPISLVDIAGMTGYVEPAMIYAIADIITLVNEIGDGSKYGDFAVPLGDFMFIGGAATLVSGSTLMTPGYSLKGDSQFDEVNLAGAVAATQGGALAAFGTLLGSGSGDPDSSSLVSGLSSGTAAGSSGFDFPLFDDPSLIFGLLLGKDIPLITYDLAPFGMDFSYTQKFPIWDALFVRIGGSVGLTIDLAFGYDTAGVRQFAEGGFSNPLDLLGGLYVSDTNQPSGEGTDVPELILKGELFAGAELNLGIASAGAEGAIGLIVNFDLYDPDSDGKVRVDELLGNFLYEFNYGSPALAPIAIFDVTGQVYAQLRAFIESLFFKYEFEITPPITLFEFDIPFEREPFLATERGDGSLLLNIGPNAAQRLNGDTRDIDEVVFVASLSDTEVEVWNNTTVRRSDAQRYSVDPTKGIFGYGGSGNDTINLAEVTHQIVYTIEGGVGDDILLGTAGGGSMMGGLGNDTMTGGAGVDYAYGGDGNDTIDGAAGNDFLFGDSGIVRTLSDEGHDPDFDLDDIEQPFGDRIRSFVGEKDGDDRILGGAGLDVILGGGANDWIEGGDDSDVVLGDGGNFDRQAGVLIRLPDGRLDVNARGAGGKDTVFGNSGGDFLFGGTSDDLVDGGADDDEIEGGMGFDTLYGGSDADLIYGGGDADVIFGFRDPQGLFFGQEGEAADAAGDADLDGADDSDGIDLVFGEEGNDFIRGNGANDILHGGAGADILFGDQDNDQVFGEAGADIAFGGADDDIVDGSDGADTLFGDDGLVVYFNFTADASPAFNFVGSRIRYVDGNADNKLDQLIGDSAESLRDDSVGAADTIATSVDVILTATLATDGSDTVIGGDGRDVLFGGGSDGVGVGGNLADPNFDTMFGDFDPNAAFNGPRPNGQDTMVGDGGRIELFGRRTLRAASESGPEDGKDVMSGNDHGDFMFGGGFSDEMHGFEPKVLGAYRIQPLTDLADNDVMLGDHGEILFNEAEIPNRIEIVRTTYAGASDSGRSDTMYGTFGNDVMFGGLNGSMDVIEGGLGQDIALGDQGAIYFHDDPLTAEDEGDADLDTLDLIRSFLDGLGGSDIVSGGEDADVLIGGTAGDEMYGDNATASSGAADGEDIMLGDNADIWLIDTQGRLTVRVAAMTTGTAVDLITTTDPDDNLGGPDTMSGNAGADIVFGGVNAGLGLAVPVPFGNDVLYGDRANPTTTSIADDGNDILVGDNGLLDFTYLADADRHTLDLIRSFEDGSGGVDIISGNKGADVAVGGTDDDQIYGDDGNASSGASDGSDALLGDNADIFLVAVGGDTGADLRLVLGSAVMLIRTTDEENPAYGGEDTISGNAKGDIIAGGVQGDLLYGYALLQADPDDGNDVMLGDNGALEWLSNGRFSEIRGIDIAANNPALWAKYGTATADTDLGTLDLITTEQPNNGARDEMYGNAANDIMAGGTDLDEMHGSAGDDAMFGDHARVYPQFSFVQIGTALVASPTFSSRNYFAIDTRATDGGQGDRMWGDAGDDVMLGQQGDDRMWGGDDDDDMIGGHNVSGTYASVVQAAAGVAIDEFAGDITAELQSPDNFMNDAMDGGAGDDAMAGDNAIIWRRGDDLSPRFRLLTAPAIYTTGPATITLNIGPTAQSDPNDADGRDIQLVDHDDDTAAGLFGWDVMAGGADNDVMYGQLGDDLMQGDGSISLVPVAQPLLPAPQWVIRTIVVTDAAVGPPNETLYFNVPEDPDAGLDGGDDGDDYMEGNGGRDLMYGGLGQDDMLGGSSALFGLNGDLQLGLTANEMRPDDSDTMFGGAGIDIARNHVGDATLDAATNAVIVDVRGHALDADYMMGDNANVYRVVKAGDLFERFNYDNYTGDLRIVPRGMVQLDYTLGGSDFAGGTYNGSGQAQPNGVADNGAADLIHGEAGDDIIFGMTGSDVLFGEGQDDDIIGGYGHDWISGGTGQDGVLGDDGLLYTSRNSTFGEVLYSIAPLLASDADTRYSNGNALNELIATPGSTQTATINKTGELKKTVDLVPFSFDSSWLARDDEFPDNADAKPFADDIVFGGWGSDWLHGGSGDDAMLGGEALNDAYVPVYNALGTSIGVLDLGYDSVGIANALVVNPNRQNPGNVLFFHPDDLDGQHLNNRFRAGEFELYDEYNPRVKILLDATGKATLDGTGVEFLLAFAKGEAVQRPGGTVPKATGQQTETYGLVADDGADAIFGDLGNDWIVGGTGRDNVYGGWGNDLLQVDDDLDTETVDTGPQDDIDARFDNEAPETHPTYEDRAYGGAGRDVLIGNTGGDRLIDWVGEYNSYIVPFAPFGQATVSRTLQPYLPEFLYALSAGDGADPTRYRDVTGNPPPAGSGNNPNPSRNGEPNGELGLVLQKDFAWGDQTGAPADPQAGNIPGGPRDVLRSADFAGNNASSFVAASGTWTVANNAYEVAPLATSSNKDAISLFNSDVSVPNYFEITATLNALKPVGGFKANAYIIFDYYSPTDFKFAGLDISTNKIQIGQRASGGFQVLASQNMILKAGTDYNVLVAINGSAVTLVVNNAMSVSYAFAPRVDADGFTYGINSGMYGLGADNAKARIDNTVVQRIPPKVTLTLTDGFDAASSTLLTQAGAGWTFQPGRMLGSAANGAPFALATNDIAVSGSALLKLDATFSTMGLSGIAFDVYSPTDFKWAAVSKTSNQVLVGHYTARGGWVVDHAVTRTLAAGDNSLSLTLRGTTVNVALNGQAVLSRVYNSNVVDGAVGLFSRTGTASFDSFSLQTDDAKFATATALSAPRETSASRLSTTSATPVTDTSTSFTSSFTAEVAPATLTAPVVLGRSEFVEDAAKAQLGVAPRVTAPEASGEPLATAPAALGRSTQSFGSADAGAAATQSAEVDMLVSGGSATSADEAPEIAFDWSDTDIGVASVAAVSSKTSAAWLEGFLLNGGRRATDPNARLRITA